MIWTGLREHGAARGARGRTRDKQEAKSNAGVRAVFVHPQEGRFPCDFLSMGGLIQFLSKFPAWLEAREGSARNRK